MSSRYILRYYTFIVYCRLYSSQYQTRRLYLCLVFQLEHLVSNLNHWNTSNYQNAIGSNNLLSFNFNPQVCTVDKIKQNVFISTITFTYHLFKKQWFIFPTFIFESLKPSKQLSSWLFNNSFKVFMTIKKKEKFWKTLIRMLHSLIKNCFFPMQKFKWRS